MSTDTTGYPILFPIAKASVLLYLPSLKGSIVIIIIMTIYASLVTLRVNRFLVGNHDMASKNYDDTCGDNNHG